MSKSNQEMNGLPIPTLSEMETLLLATKPRPTAQLRRKLRHAPWFSQEGEFNMIQIRKLEFVVAGVSVLLFAIIAAVIFLEWPASGRTALSGVIEGGSNLSDSTEFNQTTRAGTPVPTPVEGGRVAWMTRLPGEAGDLMQSATGITYGGNGDDGRLFIANGYQGVQIFSKRGEHLGTMPIVDPETDQPVFVHDVAWSQLLWLGPPEYGLIVLSDPFETGQYLHIVNPDSGVTLNSFEHNNNIALPMNSPPTGGTLPTQLSASGNGELYVDRVYNFSPEASGQPTNSLHYLLRMVLDGRILNPMLVNEGPTNGEGVQFIAAIAYQNVTGHVYAATYQGTYGIVQKFDLVGTPRELAILDEDVIRWQEGVALSIDDRGHVFILVDDPGYLIEVDQDDHIVNVYGFGEMAADTNYQVISQWLPGGIGQPLAMAVTPDGSMLFIVDNKQGQINLTAFTLMGVGD